MRILLAEDDQLLGNGVQKGLCSLGYIIDWVKDGIAAELAVKNGDNFDALILDLGLPRKDGLDVLRQLRLDKNDIPVLILTARDAVSQRIEGLDLGADDYLTKPFDIYELAARIRAIGRRRYGQSNTSIRIGDINVDLSSRVVLKEQNTVSLSAHEFSILEHLVNNQGRVVSKHQIESAIYGWDEGVESNAIEVHIHHLRKKLGSDLIKTVRGVGYSIPKNKT